MFSGLYRITINEHVVFLIGPNTFSPIYISFAAASDDQNDEFFYNCDVDFVPYQS